MVAELCGVVGARASGVIPFLTAHVPMRYMCGRWTLCGCFVRCCLPSLGFSFCALFPSKFLGSVPLCVRCVWRVLLPVGGVLLLSTSPSRLPLDPYPPPAVGLLAASRLRCCVALYPRHPPWHACTLTPRSPLRVAPRCHQRVLQTLTRLGGWASSPALAVLRAKPPSWCGSLAVLFPRVGARCVASCFVAPFVFRFNVSSSPRCQVRVQPLQVVRRRQRPL